jgi:hypothetical protein
MKPAKKVAKSDYVEAGDYTVTITSTKTKVSAEFKISK